jgi:hypothetical protein
MTTKQSVTKTICNSKAYFSMGRGGKRHGEVNSEKVYLGQQYMTDRMHENQRKYD